MRQAQVLILLMFSVFGFHCDRPNRVTGPNLEIVSERELNGLLAYRELIDKHAQATILVNFWSAGCNACRYEAPVLNRIFADYGSKIVLLAINVDPVRTIADARKYAASLGLQFDVHLDKDRQIFDSMGLRYLPTSFFYGRDKEKAPIVVNGALEYRQAKSVLDELLNN